MQTVTLSQTYCNILNVVFIFAIHVSVRLPSSWEILGKRKYVVLYCIRNVDIYVKSSELSHLRITNKIKSTNKIFKNGPSATLESEQTEEYLQLGTECIHLNYYNYKTWTTGCSSLVVVLSLSIRQVVSLRARHSEVRITGLSDITLNTEVPCCSRYDTQRNPHC
jgi:hypothetical protein